MSAARLREAARVLRMRASDARAGNWAADGDQVWALWSHHNPGIAIFEGSLPEGNRINAAYVAMMHPPVAVALADWLSEEAARSDEHDVYFFPLPALALVEEILGGAR